MADLTKKLALIVYPLGVLFQAKILRDAKENATACRGVRGIADSSREVVSGMRSSTETGMYLGT
jgi:hypothetical protein